jgi:hypothetical protein
MSTYNSTKGDTRVAAMDYGQLFVARIPIVVSEIIAAHETLTTNGYITIADIIQLWDVPKAAILLPGLGSFKTVVAGTASATGDIGIAGSTEIFNATALDGAAGTIAFVADDATWGTDNYGGYDFEATDTIDFTVRAANLAAGSFLLFLPGYMAE